MSQYFVTLECTNEWGDESVLFLGPFRTSEAADRMVARINRKVDYEFSPGAQPAPRAYRRMFDTFEQVAGFIEDFRPGGDDEK